MLPNGLARVLALADDARVLDVGGWAAPLNRADWVIDAMPFETRGAIAPSGVGPGPARFDASRWVVADLCSSRPWPFDDGHFDFAVCTFTLEDLRDPIRVCEEMSRVARAGYVEVPSVLDELTWMNPEVSGGPWVGHAHHRWLCTLEAGELVFTAKFGSLGSRSRLRIAPRRARTLSEADRVLWVDWEGSLPARERMTIDSYPFEELIAVVEGRFPRSRAAVSALELRDRVASAVRRRWWGGIG